MFMKYMYVCIYALIIKWESLKLYETSYYGTISVMLLLEKRKFYQNFQVLISV